MQKNRLLQIMILAISISAMAYSQPAQGEETIRVTNLRCEYLTDPLAVNSVKPRLGWTLESDERGQKQTAYQVLVASSMEKLSEDKGDLWDSGKVASGQTSQVVYKGRQLKSRMVCYWKLRVWNMAGRRSSWSKPAMWGMGLLSPADWKAKWIASPDNPVHRTSENVSNSKGHPRRGWLFLTPARHLRKAFSAETKPVRAMLYTTSLGVHTVEMNGQRVGDWFLAPGWTSYNKRLNYLSYDVTEHIAKGSNAIAVTIADGFYAGYTAYGLLTKQFGLDPKIAGRYYYGKTPAALVQLELEYADGRREFVVSDTSWKSAIGPIKEADILMGETYDARDELTGWSSAGYDDSSWKTAAAHPGTKASLEPHPGVSVRAIEEIKPVSLKEHKPGVWIYDLGQNISGVVRLKVKGKAGDKVVIRYAEMLHADGRMSVENLRCARSVDSYTLKGDPDGEEWTPEFTYHGFQYVEISGYPGKPSKDSITGIVIHSDTPMVGSFECSDPMLNRLYKNIVWTQRGNFFDIPTDCPQRDERMGWTGDAQVYVRAASYNADISAFYTKWLRDLNDDQWEHGPYPPFAPTPFIRPGRHFATAWGDAGIICPWTIWRVYGDTQPIEEHWAKMEKYMNFRLERDPNLVGTSNADCGYGDWLALHKPKTPIEYIDLAYHGYTAALMAEMAEAVGKSDRAAYYQKHAEKLRQQFAKQHVLPDGKLKTANQSTYAIALFFDLIPEGLKQKAADELARMIRANGNRMSTGFLGTRPLLPVLSAHGHHDLAGILIQQKEYPSWGYEVENGATTIWERWNSYIKGKGVHKPDMNSFSHYAFGAVCEWMFAELGGIDLLEPGYKRIKIAPRPTGTITKCAVSTETPHGKVSCSWKLLAGQFSATFTIPPNTEAVVTLPITGDKAGPQTLGSGTYTITGKYQPEVKETGSAPFNSPELIFLLGGQSNMFGNGFTADLPDTDEYKPYRSAPANVSVWNSKDKKWQPLEIGKRYGPEIGFGHALSKALPGKHIGIVKYAVGGTSMDQWAPGGEHYTRLLTAFRDASDNAPNAKLAAMLWHQGENDSVTKEVAEAYHGKLVKFIASVRNDTKEPNLLFILGQINPANSWCGRPYFLHADIVRKAQEELNVPNTVMIKTDDFEKNPYHLGFNGPKESQITSKEDNVHYSAKGQIKMGRRFAKAYLVKETGSAPFNSPELIFLLGGQSNMYGNGFTADLPDTDEYKPYRSAPANVSVWNSKDKKWQPLEIGKRYGPEIGFGHALSKALPSKHIGIVKYAASDTSMDNWAPGGKLYTRLITAFRDASENAPNAKLAAMLWHQGESDSNDTKEVAEAYHGKLVKFIASVRNDTKEPNLLFILGQINPGNFSGGRPHCIHVDIVRKAQEELNVPNTVMIKTDDCEKNPYHWGFNCPKEDQIPSKEDNIHYSAKGQIKMGRRFAKAYLANNMIERASIPKEARIPAFTLWQLPNQTRSQMNSYVIRTAGNEIIVMDGGRKKDADYLRKFIRDRGNHVHAWFISHPHLDHVDALTAILKKTEGMTIDAIYASLPDDNWLKKHQNANTFKTQMDLKAALKASGHKVLDLSLGQKIRFQGVTFEILGVRNPELTVNAVNNQSVVWRVDGGGKSVLFLGDLGVEGGDKLLSSSYRSRLKADYVQMAHHGQAGVSEDFYKAVNPKFCLWPTPDWLWENDSGKLWENDSKKGRNSGPWKTLEVRAWMKKLNIEKHYILKDGLQRIDFFSTPQSNNSPKRVNGADPLNSQLTINEYAPGNDSVRFKCCTHICFDNGKEIVTDLSNDRFVYRDNPAEAYRISPIEIKGAHSVIYNHFDKLYYACDTENNRIIAFADLNSKEITASTSKIDGIDLVRPHDIILDPETGWLYTINPNEPVVFRFKSIGVEESSLPLSLGYSRALTLVDGKLYVIASSRGEIIEIEDFSTAAYKKYKSFGHKKKSPAGSWDRTGLIVNDADYFKGYWYATSFFCDRYAKGTDTEVNKFIRFKSLADFESGNWEDLTEMLPANVVPYYLTVHDDALYLPVFNHANPGQNDKVYKISFKR